MPIIPWHDPFEEVEQMIKDFHPVAFRGDGSFVPSVNVYETDKEVVVESAIPGVDPKDIDVSIENDMLTLRGETKKTSEVDEKDFYRKEIRQGSFFRRVALPASVVGEKAQAEFKGGLVKVVVPKAAPTKPKSIKIDVKEKN